MIALPVNLHGHGRRRSWKKSPSNLTERSSERDSSELVSQASDEDEAGGGWMHVELARNDPEDPSRCDSVEKRFSKLRRVVSQKRWKV